MYRIFADDKLIYDPNIENYIVQNPSFKVEANTCGECSFNIFPTHPLYSSLEKLRTVIQVEENGDVVFRGRIVDDGKDINTVKNIDCEGVLAYTNDSIVPPFSFPDDFNTKGQSNVVEFFLKWLIDNHNSQVQDFQKLKLGTVTVKDRNNYISRSSDSYASTWDVMKEKLFESSLGGYLLIRYESDGNYIDYLDDFTLENKQDIVFGKNIIDMTMSDDASEFYTVIVPLGANLEKEEGHEDEPDKRLTIEEYPDGYIQDGVYKKGIYLYKPELIEKYGWIVAPVEETTWDDVHELQYLKLNGMTYFEGVDTFNGTIEINAFDLHNSDETISSFRINRYIHCILAPHGIDVRIPLIGLECDMEDVQNTVITLGKTKRGLISESMNNFNNLQNQVEEIPQRVNKDIEYKLVNYYTKVETDKIVTDTVDEWSQQMSKVETETKQYASQYTNEALKEYTKTNDMKTYVKQTAEGITSETTKTLVTKDEMKNLSIDGDNLFLNSLSLNGDFWNIGFYLTDEDENELVTETGSFLIGG